MIRGTKVMCGSCDLFRVMLPSTIFLGNLVIIYSHRFRFWFQSKSMVLSLSTLILFLINQKKCYFNNAHREHHAL